MGKALLDYSTFTKSDDLLHKGIDTLVYYLHDIDDDLFNFLKKSRQVYRENTDFRNETSWLYSDLSYTIEVNYTRMGCFVVCNLVNNEFCVPVSQLFFNAQGLKFTLYGGFWRMCTIFSYDREKLRDEMLHHFLPTGVSLLLLSSISRVDYCFDVPNFLPDDVYNTLKTYNGSIARWSSFYIDDQDNAETIYIWSRQTRGAFCRIYNKTLDNKWKNKQNLYKDYPSKVTRIEFQFWSDFCEWFTLREILQKINTYTSQDEERLEPFYVRKKYDSNFIYDIDTYVTRYVNSTYRLFAFGFDVKDVGKRINQVFLDKWIPRKVRYRRK